MKIPFFSNSIRERDRIITLVSAFVLKFDEQNQPLYITKLLKLLFYFDFLWYKHQRKSFTGDVYVRLPYGPVPSIIKDQLDLLKNTNEENEEIDEYDLNSVFSKHLTAEPDNQTKGYIIKLKTGKQEVEKKMDNYLTDWDRALIDELVRVFKETSVRDIVEQTHKEEPYKKTSEMEIITYLLANRGSFPRANITVPL